MIEFLQVKCQFLLATILAERKPISRENFRKSQGKQN